MMINEQDKQTEVPTEDILVEVKRVDVHSGDLTMNLGQGSKLPWAGTIEIDGIPVSNITEITLHVKMGVATTATITRLCLEKKQ